MNIKIGSFIISKSVWIRYGLAILLAALPAILGLPLLYFTVISLPAILLASRATKQFRIDNGCEGGAHTPTD